MDGVRLRDIGRADRVDELSFELPLVGGDRPLADLQLADIATLLETHLAPDDPLASYAPRLTEASLSATLRGYLTGSLDLVLRLPDERFVVVDYKTNRLGGPDETLTRGELPAGRCRRRDGGGTLSAAGAALHRRPAPLPAVADAATTTRNATSAARSTCSCGG